MALEGTDLQLARRPRLQRPTEAANNLIKRVKRSAFGFTNFDNYRIRALLYAGKPDWALLETLTPTQFAKSRIPGGSVYWFPTVWWSGCRAA